MEGGKEGKKEGRRETGREREKEGGENLSVNPYRTKSKLLIFKAGAPGSASWCIFSFLSSHPFPAAPPAFYIPASPQIRNIFYTSVPLFMLFFLPEIAWPLSKSVLRFKDAVAKIHK